MPARPYPRPPEGTFIIMQQRAHDRIRFEVSAGKMVSIRVEPGSGRAPDPVTVDEVAFPDMDTKGNC